MSDNALTRGRRRFGWGMAATAATAALWVASPGLPVLWGPRADAATKAAGLSLFEHEWRPHDPMASADGDGLGPVFNARSCVACHFQGGVGGGGGNEHNVRAFEAVPTKDRREVRSGLVHAFAVENKYLEGDGSLRKQFPVIPNGVRVVGDCVILARDFDPVRTESINSTALFGVGWIDRISSKTISQRSLRSSLSRVGRELTGDFKGVPPGRYRVLPDGRVGKFGWKAQFATLEEFVGAACADEIGLGTPRMPQARPMEGPGYPDVAPDLDESQFRAMLAFVDTLPRPEEVAQAGTREAQTAARGKVLFETVGCAICHTPDLGGVTGIYSDFLLHRLEDRTGGQSPYGVVESPDAPIPAEHPKADEWKTSPLWGVADSAPYFHDGASPTLETAILRHRGDGEEVTESYKALLPEDREAIVDFLRTLKAPPDAKPARPAAGPESPSRKK